MSEGVSVINRSRAWFRAKPLRGDLAVTVICLALTIPGTAIGTHQRGGEVGPVVALLVVSCLPLTVRSRFPLPVVWVTAAITAFGYPLDGLRNSEMPPVACALALFSVASRTDRRTALRTAACTAVALTAMALILRPGLDRLPMNVAVLAWTSLAVAIGDSVRSRRELLASAMERAENAERTKEEEALRRVAEERIRIARELHDVVAHHITLVNAQAGVAHHLLKTHPDNAAQALERIRDTSRSALDELRATVGLLRGGDESPGPPREPAPGLADLDPLLAGFRHAGLAVEMRRSGTPREIPALTDLTAYRIIQEALTNAHKHSGSGAAQVDVEVTADAVRISVVDEGAGARRPAAAPALGTGHGMIGMTERAKALGGTFAAGPRPGGGFRVDAELPLRRPRASASASVSPAPATPAPELIETGDAA